MYVILVLNVRDRGQVKNNNTLEVDFSDYPE